MKLDDVSKRLCTILSFMSCPLSIWCRTNYSHPRRQIQSISVPLFVRSYHAMFDPVNRIEQDSVADNPAVDSGYYAVVII